MPTAYGHVASRQNRRFVKSNHVSESMGGPLYLQAKLCRGVPHLLYHSALPA